MPETRHAVQLDTQATKATVMELEGEVAVVTGAASGIGLEIASTFVAEGAAVAIADVDLAGARERASRLGGSGRSLVAVGVDVREEAAVARMVDEVTASLGAPTVLVNNAAAPPRDGLLEMSMEDWDDDIAITLRGAALCTRAVLPSMIEGQSGTILNVVSVNAFAGLGNEAYSAAKAGLVNLTMNTAVKYGPRGVRCNAIAPGTVPTESWCSRRDSDEVERALTSRYPLRRLGTPRDVADAAVFLASRKASWITGSVLRVDGGLMAGDERIVDGRGVT